MTTALRREKVELRCGGAGLRNSHSTGLIEGRHPPSDELTEKRRMKKPTRPPETKKFRQYCCMIIEQYSYPITTE